MTLLTFNSGSVFFPELVGTALLILMGCGVVAGVLLAHSKAQNSGWIVITFGWGMAVFVAVTLTLDPLDDRALGVGQLELDPIFRGEIPRIANADAERAPRELPVMEKRREDLFHHVDRDGKPDPLAAGDDGGIDADYLAVDAEERPLGWLSSQSATGMGYITADLLNLGREAMPADRHLLEQRTLTLGGGLLGHLEASRCEVPI